MKPYWQTIKGRLKNLAQAGLGTKIIVLALTLGLSSVSLPQLRLTQYGSALVDAGVMPLLDFDRHGLIQRESGLRGTAEIRGYNPKAAGANGPDHPHYVTDATQFNAPHRTALSLPGQAYIRDPGHPLQAFDPRAPPSQGK